MKSEKGIQSVYRTLSLLSLFGRRHPHLGVTEISRKMDLPKGTVHGFVRTLSNMKYLQQDPTTRKYHLGLKIYELGAILADSLEINQKATIPTRQLVYRTHLTARIAVWDGDSALITLIIDSQYDYSFVRQIGPRIPAYCSAVGKALLAFLGRQELSDYLDQTELVRHTSNTITQKEKLLRELEEIRRRGYSKDREESTPGLACIAAPIFGRDGNLEAAISLSGDPDRVLGKQMKELVHLLVKTAREISRSMGYFSEFLELKTIKDQEGRKSVGK
jgi:DNA-binding IclR family transcriptional regulator